MPRRPVDADAPEALARPPVPPRDRPRPRRWIVHPFLIAVFPILFLYAHNIYETSVRSLALPIGLSLAATAVGWGILRVWSGDADRAALAVSLILVLFFGFHQVEVATNSLLEQVNKLWVPHQPDLHPSVIMGLEAVAAVPLLLLIFRRLRAPAVWSAYLNGFAAILVILPLVDATQKKVREPRSPILHIEPGIPIASPPPKLPDIYFIVLDAYARSDVMRELYDVDNRPFLDHLARRGFFVAREGRSNYAQTVLSLSSTLNGDYLDAILAPGVRTHEPLVGLIQNNLIIRSLRPLGYKFVAFASGYDPTECTQADTFLYHRDPTDNFQMVVARMTPLRALPLSSGSANFYGTLRERILFDLDTLPEIASDDRPTFTFAHIIAPHHPFVLDADGRAVDPRAALPGTKGTMFRTEPGTEAEYREGYRQQATFLTRRIEQVIDQILDRSPEPPIILLESDHGSGLHHHPDSLEATDLRERMSNLNCVYFPNQNYAELYPTITPVNTFRVMLNANFGTRLPLRPDRNLFSTSRDALQCVDVTDRIDAEHARGRKYDPPAAYTGMIH